MSSFFTHGSLPNSMIANVFVPVIKSKTGRIDTCPNQFVFKRNHSTAQSVYIMYLKRLSTLIVFLMGVSSLGFFRCEQGI